jgi:hypothetical protein
LIQEPFDARFRQQPKSFSIFIWMPTRFFSRSAMPRKSWNFLLAPK